MIVTHELKIDKQWADAKLVGDKPFEVRKNDRGFQRGDFVHYTVVDPVTKDVIAEHPLHGAKFEIRYVLAGLPGIEQGYCAFFDTPATNGKREKEK